MFILRLAPAIVIGPLGGVIADRLDRRLTMVVCDVARFALFLSIPIVGTLWWLFVGDVPHRGREPDLDPGQGGDAARTSCRASGSRRPTSSACSRRTASAPVAAAVFAGLALVSGMLDNAVSSIDEVDLALFFNAATFLVSAPDHPAAAEIPAREPLRGRRGAAGRVAHAGRGLALRRPAAGWCAGWSSACSARPRPVVP